MLFGREMAQEEWLAYEDEKEGLVYRELSRGRIALVAGLPALLERLAAGDVPVALATSAGAERRAHPGGGRAHRCVSRRRAATRSGAASRRSDVFIEACAGSWACRPAAVSSSKTRRWGSPPFGRPA
ncbi:MAG: hypothetical protein R2708_05130 [Vicinamibacterales bacterium]